MNISTPVELRGKQSTVWKGLSHKFTVPEMLSHIMHNTLVAFDSETTISLNIFTWAVHTHSITSYGLTFTCDTCSLFPPSLQRLLNELLSSLLFTAPCGCSSSNNICHPVGTCLCSLKRPPVCQTHRSLFADCDTWLSSITPLSATAHNTHCSPHPAMVINCGC